MISDRLAFQFLRRFFLLAQKIRSVTAVGVVHKRKQIQIVPVLVVLDEK
jgi:hypothetical protein